MILVQYVLSNVSLQLVRQIPKQSPVGITNGKYLQLYQFCFESFLRFLLGVWCLRDLFVSVVVWLAFLIIIERPRFFGAVSVKTPRQPLF